MDLSNRYRQIAVWLRTPDTDVKYQSVSGTVSTIYLLGVWSFSHMLAILELDNDLSQSEIVIIYQVLFMLYQILNEKWNYSRNNY